MRRGVVGVLFITILASGCATGGLHPGTGDISFRISWTGMADLDLYAVSPLGERLNFIRPAVESGGVLDIDCNRRPDPTLESAEGSSWLCAKPMENIYWPEGNAPEGTYKYWVVLADTRGLLETDVYRLEVRLGKQIIRSKSGNVAGLMTDPVNTEIDFLRQ